MKKAIFLCTGLIITLALSAQKNNDRSNERSGFIPCVEFHETKPLTELFANFDPSQVKLKKEDDDREREERKMRKAQKFPKTVKDGTEYGNDPFSMQISMGNNSWPKAPIKNWAGQSSQNFDPLDPTGAAGPNHYVQMINSTTFKVYDKSTGSSMLTATLSSLFGLSSDNGDPIVLYDKAADRWFLAEFGTSSDNKIYIAVSKTNDPTGAYYTYTFVSPDFPDYLKFSVWQDGYYMTSNNGSPSRVFCFERSKMLAGNSAARSVYATYSPPNGSGFFCPLPGDAGDGTLPAAGTPCPLFSYSDNGWGTGYSDAVNIYNMTVNWTVATPTATITSAAALPTTAFDASYSSTWNDCPQPGTTSKLDGIGGVCMFRAQYKQWGCYNSVVLNWAVKISTSQRSIKWCELRQTAGTWSIYQQGTYTPDTDTRWLGSIAMDNHGSIGIAYLKSNSSSIYPGLYYTGRTACDALGTLPLTEAVAQAGLGSHTGTNRDGDYSQTWLDPDGVTFWHTGMYFGSNGTNQTKIFSFQITPCSAAPVAAFTPPASACANTATQFIDASTNSPTCWLWSVSPSTGVTITSSTSQNPTMTFATAGTYSVTMLATNSSGSTWVTKTVSVTSCSGAAPVASFSIAATKCRGTAIAFTDNSTNSPTSWGWACSSSTGVTINTATSQNPTMTFANAGAYTVSLTATNANGSNTTSQTFTVNATPTVTATSQTMCAGSSATLTASGGTTYSWNTGATTASITVTPTTTTIYTVTGTTSGCNGTATSTVTVNALPNVTASSATVCRGTSATITGSGASAYSWNTGATTASITVTPTVTTTYTVTGTTGGCSKTATSTVTVNATPTVTATSQTMCAGSSATLTASGGTTYSWNTGATTASITVTPTVTTTYTVTGTTGGCSKTATSTVTVNALPNVTASSATVCSGASATITGSGASAYSWNTGATTASITVTPTVTTTYTVTGTTGGCSKTATSTVTVNALPNVTASSATVCSGASATITGSGASAYSWNTGATTASITVTPTVTTTYTVTGTTGGCSKTATSTVTVGGTSPATPASVSGPTSVCSNALSNVVYTTGTLSNVTSYNWTIPSNVTIVSGQGTNTLTVNFSTAFTTGSISVSGVNSCGTGNSFAITVTKIAKPATPGTISGPSTNICASTGTYSVVAVAGATSYSWTVPTGVTIVSGLSTNNISVSYGSTFTAGTVSVTASNSCGTSAARALSISKPPAAPAAIYGPSTNACIYSSTAATYSVAAISGATSYTWTVPTGATLVSGQGTNIITVKFVSTYSTGVISVKANNSCSASAARTLSVSPAPAVPVAISGPSTNACTYSSAAATYSVAAVSGATSYTWTVPTGATLVSGQGTNTITVNFVSTYSTGVISVKANNSCATSAVRTLTVSGKPATPGTISGPAANVCAATGIYSVAAVAGATSYTWTVPAGVTISSGQGTNIINVSYGSTFTSGNIAVLATNGCSNTATRTLAITKLPATPGTISGPATNACTYSSAAATYSVAAVSGATSYTWTVPTGATLVSGQGTNTITVNFVSTYSTGVISVKANNSCSTSAARTLTVSGAPAVPGTISGPAANVCAGTGTYSVAAVAGATSYTWTVPTGITISSGQGTNTISVSYGSTFTSGNVTVFTSNGCSNSVIKTLAITKIPATPGTISGPATNACTYSSAAATYSVAAVSGATSYTWTVPAGATLVSGQGTNTITVNFVSTYSTGVISVKANNSCATGAARTLTVSGKPATPGTITGQSTNLCGATTLSYSVAAISGATSYTWTVPSNATLLSGQGTNTVSISFGSAFVSGNITVSASNGCSGSLTSSLALTAVPASPLAISGPVSNLCSTTDTYSITPINGASSYNWIASTGTITAGQGTNSITVNFGNSITSGTIKVSAVNACGSSAYRSLALSNCSVPLKDKLNQSRRNEINVSGLYPNPAGSMFYVEIQSDNELQVIIETLDATGRILESKTEAVGTGKTIIANDISSQAEGIYFVRIINKSSGKVELRKIIVEK